MSKIALQGGLSRRKTNEDPEIERGRCGEVKGTDRGKKQTAARNIRRRHRVPVSGCGNWKKGRMVAKFYEARVAPRGKRGMTRGRIHRASRGFDVWEIVGQQERRRAALSRRHRLGLDYRSLKGRGKGVKAFSVNAIDKKCTSFRNLATEWPKRTI